MSRLTGADAYGLMEAYNNVYVPQELTEEQVWEEVETWVNSLIEEGYDLSDYTWEEMAEIYLDEANRAEKELGLTSRERTRARNLHQNTDTPIFYKKKNNALKDRSSSTTNTAHRNMAAKRRENASEEVDIYDVILSHLLDEGYAESVEQAEVIMVNMSEDWRESIVEEVISEGEKPFPDEKVKAKQVALRDKGSAGLDRRMKMGLARRRAKEAEKTGGSQQDAGKDWYHGK